MDTCLLTTVTNEVVLSELNVETTSFLFKRASFIQIYKNYIMYVDTLLQEINVYEVINTPTEFHIKKHSSLKTPYIDNINSFTIGKDRNKRDVVVWISENTMYIYDIYNLIDITQLPDPTLVRYVRIPECSSMVDIYLCYRDMYYYVIGKDKHSYIAKVYTPEFALFGEIDFQDELLASPILLGKDVYYISDNKLVRFDTTTRLKYSPLHFKNYKPIYFTFSLGKFFVTDSNDIRVYDWNYTEVGNPKFETFKLVETFHTTICSQSFVFLEFGSDFRHELSTLTECMVETFFFDQINVNEQWLCKVLCEVSVDTYSKNEEQLLKTFGNGTLTKNSFYIDIQQNIYIGNNIYDLTDKIPQNMFANYKNYQLICKDMMTLYNRVEYNDSYHTYSISKSLGLDILPKQTYSGRFHIILPTHAKGWHHNIENVPKDTCDVIYFVCTDYNKHGGSFFYYRHLNSHIIHAVPDIHGTMKFFLLNSNKENPLWHSIGSFHAIRLSAGFSKLSDMEASLTTSNGIHIEKLYDAFVSPFEK